MHTFNDFRSGPGAAIANRIFNIDVSGLGSWREFRSAVSSASNRAGFLDRILTEPTRMSSSEKAIGLALLHAVDYGDQADEIGGNFLRLFRQCTGDHRIAALAVLEQKD